MKKFTVLLAGAMLMAATSAWATPTLYLHSGADTFTITDGTALDANSAAGVVTFIGTVGDFNINVSTGKSSQGIGNVKIDLNSVNSSNLTTGAATLDIKFSDVNFTGANGFKFSIGGTTEGSIAYAGYVGTDNLLFSTTDTIGTGFFDSLGSSAPFKDASSIGLAPAGLFSLTESISITHGIGDLTTSFDAQIVPAPEPATFALLGAGFLGLGFFGRRRMKK